MQLLEATGGLMPAVVQGQSHTHESDHSFLRIAQMPLFGKLTPMQRVMLISNGTLTDILQAFTSEKIGVHKLAEERMPCHNTRYLSLFGTGEAIKRSVVLYGERSLRHYVYAETYLALKQLPQALAEDLRERSEPLGRLLLKYRLETFKELIDLRLGKSDQAARYLGPGPGFLIRRYKVYMQDRPCIVIQEYFPAS